jgi:hypothetical protein
MEGALQKKLIESIAFSEGSSLTAEDIPIMKDLRS